MMQYSISILLTKIIILQYLINTITTEWVLLNFLSTYLPAHTYGIYCSRYSLISGNVTWLGSSDLDVYVYAQGSNLLSSSALVKFEASTAGIQTFFMTCSITGTYYLRVQPYSLSSSSYVSYTINLRTTALPQSTYSSTFYPNELANKRKQALLLSPPITSGIAVKYESPGDTSVFSISCFGTSFSSQYKLTKGTSVCLPAESSSYIFMIKDNISSLTSLKPIQIFLYYDLTVDCSNNSTTPNQSNNASASAAAASETSLTFPIIGVIVGCVVGFAFIIILIAFCRWRLKKNQANRQGKQAPKNPYGQHNSITNFNIDPQTNCSICLDLNCNARLLCGHLYHKKCIEQWMKRNNQCPLCRGVFGRSKIEANN